MKKILWICIFSVLASCALGQDKGFIYQFELGTLFSVGKNTFRSDEINLNNMTSISYSVNRRFENPSLFARIAAIYRFNKVFASGLESGVTARVNPPTNSYGTYYAFPLQAKLLVNIKEWSEGYAIGTDFNMGYQFFEIYNSGVEESGGLILSTALVATKRLGRSSSYYFKVGFERSTENVKTTIRPREPGQIPEYYYTKQYRNQLLVSLGLSIF